MEPVEEREHDDRGPDAAVGAVELNETVLLQGLVELGPQHKEVGKHYELHQTIQHPLNCYTLYEQTDLLFDVILVAIAPGEHYIEECVRKYRRNYDYNAERVIDAFAVSLQTGDSFRARAALKSRDDGHRPCKEDQKHEIDESNGLVLSVPEQYFDDKGQVSLAACIGGEQQDVVDCLQNYSDPSDDKGKFESSVQVNFESTQKAKTQDVCH